MRKHTATFANLTLKFGDKVLLDYAEEIVLPAFLDKTLVRTYGDTTHYHFYDMSVVKLETDTAGVVGRLIKDTTLSRTQIYDPKEGLIKDEQSIRSSPSSFFVLILNNHRLIYFPETPYAPDLTAFKSTLTHFIRHKHKAFVDQQYEQLNEEDESKRVTKKELLEEHPLPTLEVIPLTSSESIDDFVRGYEKLKSIEFRFIEPNDEIDGEEMFDEIREYFGGLEPKNTKITSSNPDGLNKEKAVDVIHDATAGGTQEVKLVGVDEHGNQVKGNNEKFRVAVEVKDVPATKRGLTNRLFELFADLVEDGVLPLPRPAASASARITRKIRSLLGE
ncbi:MAG: hypothetical protein AB2793_12700 [Candidatus Thiodiazotropha sp.]